MTETHAAEPAPSHELLAHLLQAPGLKRFLALQGDPSPEDTLQDTYLCLQERISEFETLRPAFVRHAALWTLRGKQRRKRRVTPLSDLPRGAEEVEDSFFEPILPTDLGASVDREEARAALEEALSSESELDRDLFLLRAEEGLGIAEAMEELGLEVTEASREWVRGSQRRLRGRVARRKEALGKAFEAGACKGHYGAGIHASWCDAAGRLEALRGSSTRWIHSGGVLESRVLLEVDATGHERLADGLAAVFAVDPDSGLLLPTLPFPIRFEQPEGDEVELEVTAWTGLEGRDREVPAERLRLVLFEDPLR